MISSSVQPFLDRFARSRLIADRNAAAVALRPWAQRIALAWGRRRGLHGQVLDELAAEIDYALLLALDAWNPKRGRGKLIGFLHARIVWRLRHLARAAGRDARRRAALGTLPEADPSPLGTLRADLADDLLSASALSRAPDAAAVLTLRALGWTIHRIARALGKHPSTVQRIARSKPLRVGGGMGHPTRHCTGENAQSRRRDRPRPPRL